MDALERAVMAISCRDSDGIPKVADAGQIGEEGEFMGSPTRRARAVARPPAGSMQIGSVYQT